MLQDSMNSWKAFSAPADCGNVFLAKSCRDAWRSASRLVWGQVNMVHEAKLLALWWECKLIQPLRKTVWRFLTKTRNKTTIWPSSTLTIYPEETKIEKDTCIPLFTAALFTIARTWKQPRCPSTDEWIKKLWYIYTMDYYSGIKQNTSESVLMRWMNLQPITERSKSEKER